MHPINVQVIASLQCEIQWTLDIKCMLALHGMCNGHEYCKIVNTVRFLGMGIGNRVFPRDSPLKFILG